jgi:hypothetical protein
MTHAERRRLVRTIYAGASLLLIGFLPWVRENSAWSTMFFLWGTNFPGWLAVVCGAAVAVLAFLELRGDATFAWKLYLGISIYGLLHSGAFLVFGLAKSDFQLGPPLAVAAFVATGLAAIGMRQRRTKRRRRKRKTKRGPRRKSGPSG